MKLTKRKVILESLRKGKLKKILKENRGGNREMYRQKKRTKRGKN